MSILEPIKINATTREAVKISDYANLIDLANNEKFHSATGYIENGILYYDVDKTTKEITSSNYSFSNWTGWSAYSLNKQTGKTYDVKTYAGNTVTEKEVRTYNEYQYAVRSQIYEYKTTLYKTVNGKTQYKTRTGSLAYPVVLDLQVCGWKISSKTRSSYYTSWVNQGWSKSTRTTSALVKLNSTRTYYSYRTRVGTWKHNYSDITKTYSRNTRVYYTVELGKPYCETICIIRANSSTVAENYYVKVGDVRQKLLSIFNEVLFDELPTIKENFRSLIAQVTGIYTLYDKENRDALFDGDADLKLILETRIDAKCCNIWVNKINNIYGAIDGLGEIYSQNRLSRIYNSVEGFLAKIKSYDNNDVICISYKASTSAINDSCLFSDTLTINRINTDRVYVRNIETLAYRETNAITQTKVENVVDAYKTVQDSFAVPIFIQIGRSLGLGDTYNAKEIVRKELEIILEREISPAEFDYINYNISYIITALSNLRLERQNQKNLPVEQDRNLPATQNPNLPATTGGSGSTTAGGNLPLVVNPDEVIDAIENLDIGDETRNFIQSKSNSQILGKNISSKTNPNGTVNQYYQEKPDYPCAAHHIVPGGSTYDSAVKAQGILTKFLIDINDSANGVYLPTDPTITGVGAYHPKIHTHEYMDYVLQQIETCTTRQEVLDKLDGIRKLLLNGTILW